MNETIEETTNDLALTRKAGAAMSEAELRELSADALINRIQMFIRTDFGGKENKRRVVLNRALQLLPDEQKEEYLGGLALLSAAHQTALAEAMIKIAEHAVNGSRVRVLTTVTELRRRFGSNQVGKAKADPTSGVIKI